MFGTFLYLTVCGSRNRIRVRLRRLREPRYLIGFAAGMAYFYFIVFGRGFRSRSTSRPGGGPSSPMAAIAQLGAPIHFIGSVLLMVFAVASWLWPGSRTPINFTRSEVQFFFPAPVTRRQLIHYKLLGSQLALLFGSAVATVFLRPSSLATGWTLLVGMWIVLMAVRLHSMGISLSRASLAQRGAGGLVRRWAPVVVVVGAVGTLIVTAVLDSARLASLSNPMGALSELQRIWSAGVCGWILWPFAALVRLPLSGSAPEFFRALPAALGIIALNYYWVLQADASFEEAAADRAEKLATLRAAPRAARVKTMPTPFALAAEGRPELAIVWKNLILIGRYASLKMLIRLLPLVVFAGIALSSSKNGGLVTLLGMLCFVGIFMVVMMGALMARNDLRQDLGRLAVLKTWPIRGATLLRGEVAAPVLLLTAIVWLLIVAAVMLVPHVPSRDQFADLVVDRVSYGTAAMLLAPVVILVQLVVTNGLAVVFPAWISVAGTSRSRGLDVMGQRLLMMVGIWLSVLLSLLPAALVAGAVAFAIYWTMHVIPVVVPAAVAAVIVVAECWVAVELLGRVLDRTDVNAVEPAD